MPAVLQRAWWAGRPCGRELRQPWSILRRERRAGSLAAAATVGAAAVVLGFDASLFTAVLVLSALVTAFVLAPFITTRRTHAARPGPKP